MYEIDINPSHSDNYIFLLPMNALPHVEHIHLVTMNSSESKCLILFNNRLKTSCLGLWYDDPSADIEGRYCQCTDSCDFSSLKVKALNCIYM